MPTKVREAAVLVFCDAQASPGGAEDPRKALGQRKADPLGSAPPFRPIPTIAGAFRLVPGYIHLRVRSTMAVAPRHVNELSSEEAHAAFEEAAQHYLQMSGDEFLERWDAGEFADDDPAVMPVAMLLPLVGR